ncbi:MAG: cupin domain-containing protein [Solirubrobacteraceae bacterium]|nr:cupin domain-containing protein [Solirubrobacteraceae bacterium]
MPTSQHSSRRLQHASIDEVITFLETSADTGGRRTLLEVELGPGGATPMHRHRRFAECFEVLDGQLTIHADGKMHALRAGDVVRVPVGTTHRFENTSAGRVRFRTELTPGWVGFEQAQQVGFGLAGEGRVTKGGFPKDPRHVALLLEWTDTRLVGRLPALASPLVHALTAAARATGEERRLLERFVTF